MADKYRMLKDSAHEPAAKAGSIVYGCMKCDYGLSSDDSRMTGIPHMSVTLNADGDYPFFTVPKDDVEEV